MVKIGDAVSMNDPQNETITPDDRQKLVQVVGGVVVQDFGYVQDGEKISWELQFDEKNWAKVKSYWSSREKVQISDNSGHSFTARVVVSSYSYVSYFRDHISAKLEFWRV